MPKAKMICADCGIGMNHHANKIDYSTTGDESGHDELIFGGVLQEVHTCPNCGRIELRTA